MAEFSSTVRVLPDTSSKKTEEVIERLQEAIEIARQGKCHTVAILLITADQTHITSYVAEDRFTAIGGLSCLQQRLREDMRDD